MKYYAKMALTLFLITALVAGVLAGVNALTKDKIAAARAEKTAAAVALVLEGEATELTDVACTGSVQAVYEGPEGYAIQVSAAGFGGEMVLMVGVNHQGQVTGISVVSHTETAGLGAVAAENSAKGQSFRGQFQGQTAPFAVTKDGGQVEAITSATITSRAVCAGVNTALAVVAAMG